MATVNRLSLSHHLPACRLSLPGGQMVAYLLAFAAVGILVVCPVLMLLATSVNLGPIAKEGAVASLANFATAWSSPTTYATISNTLIFGLGATALAVFFGTLFAFLVERTDMPMKNFAYVAVTLTIAMPAMLYGIAWVLLLSPRIGLFNLAIMGLFGAQEGLLTRWAGVGFAEAPIQPYSMLGMIVVEGLRGIGVVFLIMVGLFRNMDPSLEEAAAVSGAQSTTVARQITLRLMLPGILAATIYFFTTVLESFEIPAVMGLQKGIYVLSTKIYLLVKTDDHGLASALGVFFLLFAVGLVLWYSRLTRRIERFATITGKGYRSRVMRIGRLGPLAAGLVWVYFLLVAVAPFLVLLWASLLPFYQVPSADALARASLKSYAYVFFDPWGATALKNTLILLLVAPAVTMLLAALVSWFVVRSRLRGRRLLDVLAFLPNSLPSIIIALAFIYMFLTMPWRLIPIYGTIWIIALAMTSRYLPFGTRTMHSAVLQIHKDLEEAALTSGVTWRTAFGRIVLPLLFPALISGWVFVGLHAIRDLTLALLLYSPNSRVVSLLMWDNWQSGDVGNASATGVVLMIAIGAITLLGRLVDRRRARRLAGD
jgi:iron(III) transport system permease protein